MPSIHRSFDTMLNLPAVVGVSTDGRIVGWNSGAERVFGYGAAEIIGQRVACLVPPDLLGELISAREKVARGEGVILSNTERLHKSGARLRMSLAVAPAWDCSGKIVGTVVICTPASWPPDSEPEAATAGEAPLSKPIVTQRICMYCKALQNDQDAWQMVEDYLYTHWQVRCSHGVCPDCYHQHMLPMLRNIRKDSDAD